MVRGGAGNDTIIGSAGNDILMGGPGNDTLDGGTAAEVATFNVLGTLVNDAGLATVTTTLGAHAAIVLTEGVDFINGAGNDAVGAAIATSITTQLALINADAGFTGGASLVSAVYSNTTDQLTLTFTPGVDVATVDTIVVALNGDSSPLPLTISAETTVTNGGNGGSDFFIFESTAAKNGVDTINGFVNGGGGDILVFGTIPGITPGFLGAAGVLAGPAVNFAAGLDLTAAANNIGVVFNKATLAAGDIAVAAAAGKIAVEDNSKAVVLVTADANGVADATNDSYKVYFVSNGAAAGTADVTVTLVGTINSATELTAANWVAGNFA